MYKTEMPAILFVVLLKFESMSSTENLGA